MTDLKEAIKKSTQYNGGKPVSSFKLTSDAQANQLEPNYFWILDFLEGARMNVEKITDNFAASPGSGQFSDMGQRKRNFSIFMKNKLGCKNIGQEEVISQVMASYSLKLKC